MTHLGQFRGDFGLTNKHSIFFFLNTAAVNVVRCRCHDRCWFIFQVVYLFGSCDGSNQWEKLTWTDHRVQHIISPRRSSERPVLHPQSYRSSVRAPTPPAVATDERCHHHHHPPSVRPASPFLDPPPPVHHYHHCHCHCLPRRACALATSLKLVSSGGQMPYLLSDSNDEPRVEPAR